MLGIVKNVIAALAFAGLVGAAHAGDSITSSGSYDFGVVSVSTGVTVSQFAGAYDNFFSFTQGAFPGVTGRFSGVDLVGDMTFSFSYGFYDAFDAMHVIYASGPAVALPSDPLTGEFSLSATYLGFVPGHKYWFELSGTASDAGYTVTLAPAVPEPETWGLMLSGIGLMGLMVRRRRQAH